MLLEHVKKFNMDNNYDLVNFCKAQTYTLEKIKTLSNCEYDDSINERDSFGWSALHYASFFGNIEICKVLIEKRRCDINLVTLQAVRLQYFSLRLTIIMILLIT